MNTYSLLCLSQFKGLGKVTLRKISDTVEFTDLDSYKSNDFIEFFSSIKDKYNFAKKFNYSIIDIDKSLDQAKEIYDRSHDLGISIYSKLDSEYPNKLKDLVNVKGIDDSPIIIHCLGELKRLNEKKKSIAIIGTREPTTEGILAGEYFTKFFALNDFNIVSGLAKGCDTLAHTYAIKYKAITTAVLAHGLDKVYPKENSGLLNELLQTGGVAISEYPVGTNSLPNYFVERDRIQAGLSDATLVIQTGIKGGTMHAVKTTLENKKLLLVVDYLNNNDHEKILGNKFLIEEQGATAIASNNKEIILQKLLEFNRLNSTQQSTLF